ncbi:MAG: putative LPS assembly protein LptD [Gemmatimonadota bacterium]
MRRTPFLLVTAGWGVGVALGAWPGAAVAQQAGGAGAGQEAGVVDQEPVDSARLRILERLQRLARPPGADSVLYVQDSVKLAEAQSGRRSAPASDSVAAELLSMPGFTMTEYEAAEADFDARDRTLVLLAGEGERARVNREGLQVQADSSILFSDATGLVKTRGMSTFTPLEGDPVESASLIYDLSQQRGSAFEAHSTFNQGGARWIMRGDMPYANPDSTFMSHARFTSCDEDVPHYHFEADEIKVVAGKVLVARPVRLYFADVPVAWLPFMAQSLTRGRSSGILTPRFSVNDIVRNSSGYKRRLSNIGFYWAMSEYADAMVALDWWSDNFIALTGSARYRWNRQFLDGSLNFRRYWRADGSSEIAMDTRHSWEMDERTQLRISSRYASSASFVRDNSFDPREVTQSIDSEGGLNRRFDWGTVSLQATRKQYLSDDRIEWTLPSANLSLSTITLFRAPSNRAHFWNNMTWSGSSSFTRRTTDRAQLGVFDPALADQANTTASLRSSVSLGNLTVAQSVEVREEADLGIPEAYLVLGDSASEADLLTGAPARDVTRTEMRWSTSVDYQQQLIGSTTLTPQLSISGSRFRSDTSEVARNFVSAPSRVSFGATLKTDIYGFFPGFGSFEAIRHKISPSFSYEWSPEVKPTELQRQVFRSRALQPKNALSVTLNQTFEAKRKSPEADSTESADSTASLPAGREGAAGEEAAGAQAGAGAGAAAEGAGVPQGDEEGPRRVQRAEVVNLLAVRTSVVRYDFVEADSMGSFLSGFETTRLSNQISSDFLRGLSVSIDHDLFKDVQREDGSVDRSFAPHLSQVNLSFALNNRSGIFRLLGLVGGEEGREEPPAEEEEEAADETDPFATDEILGEASIVPRERPAAAPAGRRRSSRGGWNANLSYSLQRPRDGSGPSSQVLNGTLTLRPTEHWDLSWRTAYDLERGQFNDHTIRLTRDLHRWKANFDFLQTATGNWTFRFEVSLTDNRDLKFDYEQRNLDAGLARRESR